MSKKAFDDALRASIEKDFEHIPKDESMIDYVFSEKFERKMQRLIKRQKSPYWKYTNTVAKRVGVFLLFFAILFGSAFSVKAIREPIIQFFTNVYECFVEYIMGEESDPKIEKEYSITKIPAGFKLVEKKENDCQITLAYEHSNGSKIRFNQIASDSNPLFNNENTEFVRHETNGMVIDIYNKNTTKYAIWTYDGYWFQFICNKDIIDEDVIEIAQSVKQLN